MQRPSFLVAQVIARIVRDQVHDSSIRKRRWLVEDQPPVLNTRSKWVRETITRSHQARSTQHSARSIRPYVSTSSRGSFTTTVPAILSCHI